MTDAIAMAGMRDDPIHYVLEAFVVGLALLSEATERLDQERALITPEERRQFIAQVSRQTARIIANRAAPVKWPVWAMIVILMLGIAAGTATGHFAWPADDEQCVRTQGGEFCGRWAVPPETTGRLSLFEELRLLGYEVVESGHEHHHYGWWHLSHG